MLYRLQIHVVYKHRQCFPKTRGVLGGTKINRKDEINYESAVYWHYCNLNRL